MARILQGFGNVGKDRVASLCGLFGKLLFLGDRLFDLVPHCFFCLFVDRRGIRIGFAGSGLFTFGSGSPVLSVFSPEFGLSLGSLGFGNFGLVPGFLSSLPGLVSL